jgi:DNA-directed RNA polymerase beta subunit
MNMDAYAKLKNKVTGTDKQAAILSKSKPKTFTDDDSTVELSTDLILKSTKRLLDINRGLPEDERDSIRFKRVMTPDKLLTERVKLDSGNIARSVLSRAAKRKSLKGVPIGVFDSYAEKLIVGNSLSSPLEEVNPMHLVEHQRRITLMGQGGISSDSMITQDVQNVHPHEFGFIDTISGPESSRIGADVRAATGTMIGDDGLIYQRFFDRRRKKHVWLSPKDLHGKVVGIPDF